MRWSAAVVLLAHATAAAHAAGTVRVWPLPAAAHNCYPVGRADTGPLDEALVLGVDNIEIDLGWDAGAKRLVVGHDAAPRAGVAYPALDDYLAPALERHWKSTRTDRAPTVLTVDWKTGNPEAVRRFKESVLDAHPDWFSSAPKSDRSPLTLRRLTVSFSGSDAAKDAYDALVPAGGTYRAFREVVVGAGSAYQDDVTRYVPGRATAYRRFMAFHWSAVERGGPARAGDWTAEDEARLVALMNTVHRNGYRARFYCLNGRTGGLPSGYRFADGDAARARWLAAARAGADWVAADEYADLVAALAPLGAYRDGGPDRPAREPLLRVADLDPHESARVTLADGTTADVRLDSVKVLTDPVRGAVRSAEVALTVNGRPVTLASGNYELPKAVGALQIDCPVVDAYNRNTTVDHWGLVKAARVRLWPAGSPWIEPGSFTMPVRQAWLASMTQMANEPVYVDGGELPANKKIYYHSGLDMGGAEGFVEIVAATDGLVVASGGEMLPGYEGTPAEKRYDVVNLKDDRGWIYRYSHMQTIDPAVKPGASVRKGQRIGLLGKEGGSGGWSHEHFEIKAVMPSGRWGTQEGYAFLWEAALREQKPDVIAVARPHRFARVGDAVALDGSKSWCRSGPVARFDWTFADGATATGPRVERVYTKPGEYSEVLKVTDVAGRTAYDFAVVQVIDPSAPDALPPTIHAAYAPTTGVTPGRALTFKVRSFRAGGDGGGETWDFGDGTPPVSVRSDGNASQHDPAGYAVTTHTFARPGDYLVRVSRTGQRGAVATARLHVRVDPPAR